VRPSARAAAAIEILDRYLDGEPVEKVLTNWTRRSRFAGSGDRAAVRDLVFSALRNLRSYAALGGGMSGRGLMIGHFRVRGKNPDAIFGVGQFAPDALTPDERDFEAGPLSEAQELDCPDWLMPDLKHSLGGAFAPVMRLMKNRAPVFVRVNLRKASVMQAVECLIEEGIETAPHELSETAMRIIRNERRLSWSAAYCRGWIELQDVASQWVTDRIEVANGERVLDLCAGGGGKILSLAARCDAEFHASDIDPDRMRDLPARAARAGIKVETFAPEELESLAPYDLVICDVPCSGSGVWRRSPEGKWSLTEENLESLKRLQAAILERAISLVAPAGRIAYVTCSMLDAENRGQIGAFVNSNPGWNGVFERSLTPLDGGDGFYLAVLQRTGLKFPLGQTADT